MICLYMDEDGMARKLARALRQRGATVTTAYDEGMINRSDADHLDYATAHGYTLFSFNVSDYLRLHAQYLSAGKSHGGIILSRQQTYSTGETMRRLLRVMTRKSAADMVDHVEFLTVWSER